MSRMPERRPSVIVSDQLGTAAVPAEGVCRVLALPRAAPVAFDTVDAQFFAVGDTLGYVGGVDLDDEPPAPRSTRRLRRPLLWAAPAAAIALGVLGAWQFHRPAPQPPAPPTVGEASKVVREPEPPTLPSPPVPAAAAVAAPALPPPPPAQTAVPTAAPPAPVVADDQAAAPQADDDVAACKQAHARRHTRETLGACQRALASHPDSADVATILAQTEFDRARFAPALSWAKKAIALDDQQAAAYVFLGGAEQALGRPAAAKIAYRRYLDLDPRGRYAADVRAVLASL